MTKLEDTTSGGPLALRSSAGFGFTVGQEVTVSRRLWEPADDCHPGGMLAQPGDRLIVRAIRDRGEWPISVSHHDRTDGMTFSVAENELRAYTAAFVKPNDQAKRRPALKWPGLADAARRPFERRVRPARHNFGE